MQQAIAQSNVVDQGLQSCMALPGRNEIKEALNMLKSCYACQGFSGKKPMIAWPISNLLPGRKL